MTRRSFLQSVIAVPLAAVGMPRLGWYEINEHQVGVARLVAKAPQRYQVVGGGAFGEFERGFSPAVIREWADALARQIDDEALRRFLPNG